jgi:hypothetical protein
MLAGISLAVFNTGDMKHQTVMAQPPPFKWKVQPGKLPLDIQLDLDKRQNERAHDSINIIDSVHIRDSVRIVEKIKWKTRYKNVADRTAAREVGMHPAAVTPDSMSPAPTRISTLGREEQPNEVVDTSKVSSIQLTVDGKVVYSRNDNHSGVEGQR